MACISIKIRGFLIKVFLYIYIYFLMVMTLTALSEKIGEMSNSKNAGCHSHMYIGADESSLEQTLGRFI